ncbi:uncharacterized protein YdhG (YjbR/CyaY superfamily) [Catenuloplanes nepalensis]|uniref:Uncharacterized protein YdhG (YjbR/CyaY superfamily) n=1 Tax=Catenuloplanes nepalensis TaxID=587533 RepID=A0ABT9MPU9_9ACTN|nr:DUF1801 domain-containing protein [Catenuloplanes nepalensis]MDP9793445.1 uncharacterized protein YdhG (YjbR/CyaY superfamily) [Catenuloplanes nepalensis]
MAAKKDDGFTAEERAAMKERAAELKRQKNSATAEADLLAKIAELGDDDRALAERLHALVREHAPQLTAKTYYGMPGWAKDGKVLVFLQPAGKFKTRYATLGFNDNAMLDDGAMWPSAYAITALTPEHEDLVAGLLKRAAG